MCSTIFLHLTKNITLVENISAKERHSLEQYQKIAYAIQSEEMQNSTSIDVEMFKKFFEQGRADDKRTFLLGLDLLKKNNFSPFLQYTIPENVQTKHKIKVFNVEEFKDKKITLMRGYIETNFGLAQATICLDGIVSFEFLDDEEKTITPQEQEQFQEAFIHLFKENKGHAPIVLVGTKIETLVWEKILHLPLGHFISYETLSKILENPSSIRVFAHALGKNKIAWFIPCHRVLHKNGKSENFRWGKTRKKIMLLYEILHSPQKTFLENSAIQLNIF